MGDTFVEIYMVYILVGLNGNHVLFPQFFSIVHVNFVHVMVVLRNGSTISTVEER